ncbi:hypothetical protein PHMEG_0002506 [Phytophthora megakarya]|uniref:Uncharacterized protein n=1 Tax=Phytophthora megakarya TaxID=4795 RepID=A0A225X0L4_9STRA|nr:hypothetical protein PHMEG_0002506 [Phytophthora megakarya]
MALMITSGHICCQGYRPVRLLAGHSPIEVSTELPASSALDVVVAPAFNSSGERVSELGDISDLLKHLRSSLQEMHREVIDNKEKKRLQDMQANKVGGPFHVTEGVHDIHASRLKFYADSALNTTEELLELVSSQGMLLGGDKFVDYRFNQNAER